MKIRFALSRDAFEQTARNYLAGTLTNTGAQWLGLYYVEKIFSDQPGAVCFQTGDSGFDPAGFAFRPGRSGGSRCVAPNWYAEEW